MINFIKTKLLELNVKDDILVDEYINFCLENNENEHYKFKTERHHILPKSIFKEFENLNEHTWNSSYLLYKNHYIAHSLLANAISNSKIINAWWAMNSINKKNKNMFNQLLSPEIYKSLRENKCKTSSEAKHLKNKSEETIQKRLNTLSELKPNGLTGFQENGLKISKKLKENESMKGEKNSMANKITVKERKNPLIKINVGVNYDKNKYIHHKIPFIKLIDNQGENYFSGWKDECIVYCNSIGLQGEKISKITKNYNESLFKYDSSNSFISYVLSLMKLAGLEKYICSSFEVLTDEQADKFIKGGISNES